jgi:uncharacterized OsmC-like protein
MTITEQTPVDNGVDVEHLLHAREAFVQTPAAGHFTWKAGCEWATGSEATTTVSNFFGLGDEQSHTQSHSVTTDHPALFGATDNGASPPELMLMGLAGCLTAGIASVAQNWGIKLNSVTATVEGDMDLAGILGADADVRNGFSDIRVRYEIDADAPRADLEAVVAQSQKRSAVYDIITNPTVVAVELA